MNINKLNLEVSKCASKEESRYLNGVHFTKNYTEATNGSILARITYPVQFDPEEMPAQIKTDKKENMKDFLVPLNGIKDIKFPKKACLPILNDVYIDVQSTNDNGIARFVSTDLQTTPVTEIRKVDGEFPDTNQIWPKDEEAVFEICLDPEYLKKLCEIADQCYDRSGDIRLTFYGVEKPVKVFAYNANTTQEFTGIIMPIRGDARDFSKPKETDQKEKEAEESF
jgi:hypothetical protein